MLFALAIGRLLRSCSVVVPCPDLLIKSRLRVSIGFGPTNSEVGVREPVTVTGSPVTVTRSASASWANAFAAKIKEKASVAARVAQAAAGLIGAFMVRP